MSVDAPARAMWQGIKQYNGYSGCGHCKEPGEHLDLGPDKKNRRRMCHVYPFNKAFAAATGHAGSRKHDEVKEQALEALKQKSQGQRNVSFTCTRPLHLTCIYVENCKENNVYVVV